MDYVIFNKKLIGEKKLNKKFEYEIRLIAEKLGKWFVRYPKPVRLDVHIKKEKETFRLNYSVDLKSGPVVLEETGEDLLETVHRLFKEFKVALKKHLEKEKRMHKRHKVEPDVIWSTLDLDKLRTLKKEEKKEDFRKVLQIQMPAIKNYITKVFNKAKEHEVWMDNQYEFSDVLDEVYIHLYERFEQHPEQVKAFKKWLYSEVNELFRSIIKEEQFHKTHLESYEMLVIREAKSMEEKYSVEHDGDYIMMEDLDDPSYEKAYLQ